MSSSGRRFRRLWWLVVVMGLLGAAVTYGLVELGSQGGVVKGLVNTRPAAVLPTDRVDLIEDLKVAVVQPSVIQDGLTAAGSSADVSTSDLGVERVGSSSIAEVSMAWSGDQSEGQDVLDGIVTAATSYLFGDPNPGQGRYTDQVEQARQAEQEARRAVSEALLKNDGISPQRELELAQAAAINGGDTVSDKQLQKLVDNADAFAELQQDATLARRELTAVTQLAAQDQVTSSRTSAALAVQPEEPVAASADQTTAVRRAVAGGLLAALLTLAILLLPALTGSGRTEGTVRRRDDQLA